MITAKRFIKAFTIGCVIFIGTYHYIKPVTEKEKAFFILTGYYLPHDIISKVILSLLKCSGERDWDQRIKIAFYILEDPDFKTSHKEVAMLLATDPALMQGPGKETPLIRAASLEKAIIVQMLLDANVTVDIESDEGLSALDYAHARGNENIVQMLKKYGATEPLYIGKSKLPRNLSEDFTLPLMIPPYSRH